MNDRFNFRAWFGGRFIYVSLGDLNVCTEDGKYICHVKTLPVLSWEQCTGLKDKNGKLIYEGDILKPNGNTITKEVVYEDGSCWAKDTIYFHDKCHIFQRWIDECGYEIVGNIHEKESK